ncbi:MAG: SUMF1/EgtB/PvdO family nonheme iron enzyme [Kiritimatiellae bacterium]|nr:SUMF1/EgtB/PvdO family nonheme iron enzyme [Kiritimatiellia bacterium]
MKKVMISLTLLNLSAFAVPEIVSVSMKQDNDSRMVEVTYALDAPAIVTAAFYTNGVKIADASRLSVEGVVNRRVDGGTHRISWCPYKDFPDAGKSLNGEVRLMAWPPHSPPLFMVVDLTASVDDNLRFYPAEEDLPAAVTSRLFKTDCLLMKRVYATGREWLMGSTPADEGREADSSANAEVAHLVTLTNDYYMGVFEVTEAQYRHVTGDYVGTWHDDELCPANNMSPNALRGNMGPGDDYDWPSKGHAVNPDSVIGRFRSVTGNRVLFDLPTEAQWEFMARGGCPYRFGITNEQQTAAVSVAWIEDSWASDKTKKRVMPVGSLLPNAWGFYDTLGNVGEWCLDWKGPITSSDAVVDPVGPETGTVRIARGTGFYWNWKYARCACRVFGWTPNQARDNHGFRLWASVDIR